MNFFKNIKRYKINSLFVKNFFAAFCVVLIPILIINVLIFRFYQSKSLNENKEFAKNELLFVQENVDRIFRLIDSNSDYMINDIYINSFLQSGVNLSNIQENVLISNVVQSQLQRIKLSDPCIESVHLYSAKTNYLLSTDGSGELEMFYDSSVKENILQNPNMAKISIFQNPNGRKIIRKQVGFNVFGIDTGILFVNIDYSTLKNSIEKNISESNNIVVYMDNGKSLVEFGERNNTNQVISISSAETGFIYSSSFSNNINIFPLLILILLISLVFVFVAALFLTYKACRPIDSIIDIMENTEDWYVKKDRLPLAGEALYILENYLDKVYYSKEIETDLRNRILDLKNSQIEALNLQIKPHFLFNTLQLISMCAMNLTDSENEAVVAIEMLSKIFKYTLTTDGCLDTVENELAFTKAYVNIQNLRYNGRIKVNFEVADDALLCKTSKIVIQPLIENSYSHGILPFKENGEITVKINRTGSRLVIEVIDNGIGITPDKLKEIKTYLKKGGSDKHIGLSNVDRKIKLMFGEEYGLHIDNTYTGGSRIIIEQPI